MRIKAHSRSYVAKCMPHQSGKLSQNLLGRLVVMEPANIRDVVQRLEKRRLVTKEPDATDRRLTLVSLTSTGLSFIRNLLPVEMECTARTLAPLNQDDRKRLCDLLRELVEG